MGRAIAPSSQARLGVGKSLQYRYLLLPLSLVRVPAKVSRYCSGVDTGVQYMRLWEFIVHADLSHLLRNDLEGHDHVGEDDLANFLPFLEIETLGVDDAHLLQDGGFS